MPGPIMIPILKFVASMILSFLFAPDAPTRRADKDKRTIGQDEIPSAEEGSEIPVVLGARWVTGANVVYWHKHKTVTRKEFYTQHYMNMHMVICQAPVDNLLKIAVDNKNVLGNIVPVATITSARTAELHITVSGLRRKDGVAETIEALRWQDVSVVRAEPAIMDHIVKWQHQVDGKIIMDDAQRSSFTEPTPPSISSDLSRGHSLQDLFDFAEPVTFKFMDGVIELGSYTLTPETDLVEMVYDEHGKNLTFEDATAYPAVGRFKTDNSFNELIYVRVEIIHDDKADEGVTTGKFRMKIEFKTTILTFFAGYSGENDDFPDTERYIDYAVVGIDQSYHPDIGDQLGLSITEETEFKFPDLFGGYKTGGGVVGTMNLLYGKDTTSPSQLVLLEALHNAIKGDNEYHHTDFNTVPFCHYKGVFSVYMLEMYMAANGGSVNPWSFLVRHLPTNLSHSYSNIDGHANPIHVVYELLTNRDWGRGLPESMIDKDNLLSIASQVHAEGLGFSIVLTRSESIEEVLEMIVKHINGGWFADIYTDGKFRMYLDRQFSGEVTALETVEPIKVNAFKKSSPADLISEVHISWTNNGKVKGEQRASVVRLANSPPESIDRVSKFSFVSVPTTRCARAIGSLLLQVNSTPTTVLDFDAALVGHSYQTGDYVLFDDPEYVDSPTVFRVVDMTINATNKTVSCIQDRPTYAHTSFFEKDDYQYLAALTKDTYVIRNTGWQTFRPYRDSNATLFGSISSVSNSVSHRIEDAHLQVNTDEIGVGVNLLAVDIEIMTDVGLNTYSSQINVYDETDSVLAVEFYRSSSWRVFPIPSESIDSVLSMPVDWVIAPTASDVPHVYPYLTLDDTDLFQMYSSLLQAYPATYPAWAVITEDQAWEYLSGFSIVCQMIDSGNYTAPTGDVVVRGNGADGRPNTVSTFHLTFT